MRRKKCGQFTVVCAALLLHSASTYAQELGHKLPGLLGLDAGRIPGPGLYFINRLAIYEAGELRNRNGDLIPTGPLNLFALANAVGVSYTTTVFSNTTFLTMTLGVPIAKLSLDVANRQEAGVDRFGLADPYIQPVRLGWRKGSFDVVTSYGIYLPTGKSAIAGGSGVSSGHITHEFSSGGTRYFRQRKQFLTALASYQLYMRQRKIDITRGDTIQIQGGAGTMLAGQLVEAGLAGYALWQVRDDRGTDLPLLLRGARDRVFGLGPEGAVMLKAINGQIRLRYEWDIGVRTRPQGSIFVAGINFVVQRPQQPSP